MPVNSAREGLLIYGASGHAKVVIDIVEKEGKYRISGLLDDDESLHGESFYGYSIIGGGEQLEQKIYAHCKLFIAVGSNQARHRLYERYKTYEYEFARIVHPSAQIGRGVSIGLGAVIMAGAVINADTVIGQQVIINTGATVDHDCVIGDFAHISPGVHLAGGVIVGKFSHLGIGTSVIPKIKVGENVIIGAGTAVVDDIPDNVTAFGVPARVIKRMIERQKTSPSAKEKG